mmetsp:Transcript_8114/g.12424  ORF Transcript_8114/g.12424 Transcript_8114/m.12424 type:complete len:455 (-) Transcript_8114:183-1547(-)
MSKKYDSLLSCCWRKCPRDDKDSEKITLWSDLLTCEGVDSWNIRLKTLVVDSKRVRLPLWKNHNPKSKTAKNQCVYVLSHVSDFQTLELDHGMDKNVVNCASTGGEAALPLTQCTGQDWIRQRQKVKQAFDGIPQRSLEAVATIDFQNIQEKNKNDNIMDLKDVVVDASLTWVVRLFRGEDDLDLLKAFRCVWQEVRSKEKSLFRQKIARKALIDSLVWNKGGVLQSLDQELCCREEATANAINAMVAAHDATQAIIFWTLWNLGRKVEVWKQCREEVLKNDAKRQKQDLERIAALKHQATRGHTTLVWTNLSYLGRALMETVRVYPPVWTLPRTWPEELKGGDNDNGGDDSVIVVAAKLDVPTTNNALDRDWDPNSPKQHTLASFGLGKRHCPAGTAALYASYSIIEKFLKSFDFLQECETDHALQSVYLGPTLCLEGPQFFCFRKSRGEHSD